jgi:hypothetical protein
MDIRCCVLILGVALAPGCATVRTFDVSDPDSTPRGVRVYAPRIYLLVDGQAKPSPQTQIVTLPDPCRAYDLRPWTLFAQQDFQIELDGAGQLKALTANQDTAAFLTFLKEGATLAAKAAGAPVGVQTIAGTFGLPDGVYLVGDDGRLGLLYDRTRTPAPAGADFRCPAASSGAPPETEMRSAASTSCAARWPERTAPSM